MEFKKLSLASLGCILCVILYLGGCSSKAQVQHFLREEVALDYVKRIAVLPLQNNTKEEFAAKLARDVVTTQVLAMGIFDVVDSGVVDSVLHEEGLQPGSPLNLVAIKRIGKRLGVEAVIQGSVDLAGDKRQGAIIFPEMSLTLNLVETTSAVVLWQASGHRDGNSMMSRLFGLKPIDSFKVALDLSHDLLSTIPVTREDDFVLNENQPGKEEKKK
jgi:TolB-like protein